MTRDNRQTEKNTNIETEGEREWREREWRESVERETEGDREGDRDRNTLIMRQRVREIEGESNGKRNNNEKRKID